MSKTNDEITNNKGYILLSRNLLEWRWYTDGNTCRFFIHCLLKANYKDKQWQNIVIPRGSFITSEATLMKELNLSRQNLRTIINRLISTNEITKSTTSKYTIFKVNNYDLYQSNNQVSNHRLTNDQPQLIKDNKENNIYSVENTSDEIPYKEIIEYLNAKANKEFKYSSVQTKKLIRARFNEGYKLDDFKKVIDIKTSEWKSDPKMNAYLRPKTLFLPSNFESYLQQESNNISNNTSNKEEFSFDY